MYSVVLQCDTILTSWLKYQLYGRKQNDAKDSILIEIKRFN